MTVQWIWLGATVVLVFATLVPLSRITAWWIRGLDFPRLQLSALAGTLLAVGVVIGVLDGLSPLVITGLALCAGCIIFHAWWILPYTRLWPREVLDTDGATPCLRLLTANVLTPNQHADRFLELVRQNNPDIFITLESDSRWQGYLDTLEGDYPFSVKVPLDNLYGMHLYSRLPLSDTKVAYLVQEDIPSIHAKVHLSDTVDLRLHVLHPAPPSPTENEESTERDAELVVVAQAVADETGPVIVTGDLNDVAWSTTTRLFRKISGLLDPRVGRGMFNTYHAEHKLLRWPLDHLYHSDHFTVSELRRLPAFGSDHFPLLVELCHQPVRGDKQEGLKEDSEDRELAGEKAAAEPVTAEDVPDPDPDR
ncbi:endonuclease/exonuclease/phosphatase family protein [Haliea sp. E1-2-M8]|uniref:endonuclease/exonuclease/phosphatase family protein n=1 Tax=Haliea sp. E1-2-M8 TaxID=3064706 RepID=UPI0027181440|nr:endonuclease/exonuclease/phosphatase family protein [Haliea sp. E1-2-M8]MDO8861040.1 endonuclease/exonuclease/phosphatase family protein [Haliea sp. E1-2-M8]